MTALAVPAGLLFSRSAELQWTSAGLKLLAREFRRQGLPLPDLDRLIETIDQFNAGAASSELPMLGDSRPVPASCTVSSGQAARAIGVSARAVTLAAAGGRLAGHKDGAGRWWFSPSEIERFSRSRKR